MCRIYFSIPVAIRDRDNVIDTMINDLAGLTKFSKAPFIFDHWKPGWIYDKQSVAKADIFVFMHPNNKFKFNIATLPVGVLREYLLAKTLGKRIYLAYKTTDGYIRYYDFSEIDNIISGIAGTTHSLATFLETYIPQVQKSVRRSAMVPQESQNPCAEIPLPEHSIELHKSVSDTSYDRRLLL
jgi:hypothetical protein